MDLKKTAEDEIEIRSPYLSEPIIVSISIPEVPDALEMSTLARSLTTASERKAKLANQRALATAVRDCIRGIRTASGDEVTFDGRPWSELGEGARVDELVAHHGLLVRPLLDHLAGATLGADTRGKSLRQSDGES